MIVKIFTVSSKGVNRLFVLAFENNAQRTSNKRCYLPNVEIKDYNTMIDGKNFFDQPVKKRYYRNSGLGSAWDRIEVC